MYIICFLLLLKTIDRGYSLGRGGSNEYPTIYGLSRNIKNIRFFFFFFFLSENFQFLKVTFSIFLNRQVFVMFKNKINFQKVSNIINGVGGGLVLRARCTCSMGESSPLSFFPLTRTGVWKCMFCVLIRIASSRRFYWVYLTNHYFINDRKDIPRLSQFAKPGPIIKHLWLCTPV